MLSGRIQASAQLGFEERRAAFSATRVTKGRPKNPGCACSKKELLICVKRKIKAVTFIPDFEQSCVYCPWATGIPPAFSIVSLAPTSSGLRPSENLPHAREPSASVFSRRQFSLAGNTRGTFLSFSFKTNLCLGSGVSHASLTCSAHMCLWRQQVPGVG